MVLLKIVRDRGKFSRLEQQVYPKYGVDLYDTYLHATAKPHGYHVLELSQNVNYLLRFRSGIFPDESSFPLIYSPVDYQTVTIDLSHPTRS